MIPDLLAACVIRRPLNSDVRSLMKLADVSALLFVFTLSGCGGSATVPAKSWRVSLFDSNHDPAGNIDLHVTKKEARSCLGGYEGGYLVVIDRTTNLSSQVRVSNTPVAKIEGDHFSIDLSGGICDAYVLLDGKITEGGHAAGDIHTLGLREAQTIGTFVAIPET